MVGTIFYIFAVAILVLCSLHFIICQAWTFLVLWKYLNSLKSLVRNTEDSMLDLIFFNMANDLFSFLLLMKFDYFLKN